MARRLYSLLLTLGVPLVLLRLLWRGRKNLAYRRRWGERFGWFAAPPLHAPIWVHAVSVGEVQAAVPLIHALLERYAEHSLVVTTTTPTGSQRARELFGSRVFHVYLPYDLPGAVGRFLRRVQPRLALVMETELWPNLFHHCAARGIPVVMANARLSERSAAAYARFSALLHPTLAGVKLIAARDESDAARFRALGTPPAQLKVMGNLKFDQPLPADLTARAQALRQQLGASRPVWVAASTHEGEEEQVLAAFTRLREILPEALLLLVPRHPERFPKVAELVQHSGYPLVRRTEGRACDAGTAVFLGDTLGELPLFYAAADVAFVGGSLVAVGGHNMLEPAALGVPVVFGPHLFNFQEISQALLAAGGAQQVADATALATVTAALLNDKAQRTQMGEAGRRLVAENRGALDRLLDWVAPLLSE
jgi:3-deoxy-D-manno-octulosonic-acid transferase